MGVYNEAILIYGWTFDYEEFKKLIIPFMTKNGIDEKYSNPDEGWMFLELCDKFEDVVKEKYPDMKTGRASPYYDCYPNENIFYISFRDVTDVEMLVLDMTPDYPCGGSEIDCLRLMEDLTLTKPIIEALVNVH